MGWGKYIKKSQRMSGNCAHNTAGGLMGEKKVKETYGLTNADLEGVPYTNAYMMGSHYRKYITADVQAVYNKKVASGEVGRQEAARKAKAAALEQEKTDKEQAKQAARLGKEQEKAAAKLAKEGEKQAKAQLKEAAKLAKLGKGTPRAVPASAPTVACASSGAMSVGYVGAVGVALVTPMTAPTAPTTTASTPAVVSSSMAFIQSLIKKRSLESAVKESEEEERECKRDHTETTVEA
ncbi:hypothetical protein B484DRAFT_452285 [Ochromonadaceae sp. CCMP2298]|nr:hypothetical protein B484DRAFT_452285 [Ochromonadaceae sp. CCMP2298]|eukprot:CAMPEP_0173188824 /NCGR_PEP_ID=MMETSP1141-20130122/11457_1 /TAXON_ID=483371 /ORGANISM="non described non described, Strain CCMP2298" /LENGTH=236 /DNA_ID=CAMNT_0014112771 /DNA_START=18 /DNA_END=728 /DNA_ORIENTATION=+